ncbi:hypothetical protein [Salinispora fenicalii]|uniref:hypothetical protein n=1 Tax=Salinispora fenicalii TaxID=1137263 RepID=UPI0004B7B718|nr:hypothetical protein [Salinispora fenicalii]
MARTGHDSPQAALIYQHATTEADRAIAQSLHEAMRADQLRAKKPSGSAARGMDEPGSKKGKKQPAARDRQG